MLSEFRFIENLKNRRNFRLIGDDCAVLPKDAVNDLLVTADMLVEEIDFKLGWAAPEDIGHKALAVSLSDVAAMGGLPVWALISIAVPETLWNSEFVERFFDGYAGLAERFGVEIAGGDVSRSPNGFVVDSTVAGVVPRGRAILRSGAKVGDIVYVTGSLGGAAAGLASLIANHRFDSLAERQLRPIPRIELGRKLLESGTVSAMIDISDGLSGDLGHLCRASGVGASIDLNSLPIDPGVRSYARSVEEAVNFALHGGEDFELLFTAPAKSDLDRRIAGISAIGTVTANPGIIDLITDAGPIELIPKSFRHF